jgi:hypothetical protein
MRGSGLVPHCSRGLKDHVHPFAGGEHVLRGTDVTQAHLADRFGRRPQVEDAHFLAYGHQLSGDLEAEHPRAPNDQSAVKAARFVGLMDLRAVPRFAIHTGFDVQARSPSSPLGRGRTLIAS